MLRLPAQASSTDTLAITFKRKSRPNLEGNSLPDVMCVTVKFYPHEIVLELPLEMDIDTMFDKAKNAFCELYSEKDRQF